MHNIYFLLLLVSLSVTEMSTRNVSAKNPDTSYGAAQSDGYNTVRALRLEVLESFIPQAGEILRLSRGNITAGDSLLIRMMAFYIAGDLHLLATDMEQLKHRENNVTRTQ